jgi:hypothetical protein
MDSTPYSKREQDFFIQEFKDMFSDLREDIKKDREERKAFEKNASIYFKAVSQNSGEITKLWKAHEDNKTASKFIGEIVTTWKVGKWFISIVISVLLFIIAVKNIISGGIHDGLKAIKDLF